MVRTRGLSHRYERKDEEGNVESVVEALTDVDLDIQRGQFVAVLGHNGSGKSTLAKHINALLFPTGGTVCIDGMDTNDAQNLWKVRQEAGMVFQNPDNQIIGQVVEEDVGFGPENLGVPTAEIWERVKESLKIVGMEEYAKRSPNRLSGGQKQRVSIAGVLAMHPKCIIMDEPTAMLDPGGRREVIRAARALNDVEGITIILITHYMEEAVCADRVFVMNEGRLAMQGTPREVFSRVDELRAIHLDVPQATLLSSELEKGGLKLEKGILTREELAEALGLTEKVKTSGKPAASDVSLHSEEAGEAAQLAKAREDILTVENVSYLYDQGSAMESCALKDLTLHIPEGQFTGFIGHTGSGKSTLVQLLNGLLEPTSGRILYRGRDIRGEGSDRRKLRSDVGLVFQYPEYQLFEADVLTDVMFGPKNLGLTAQEQEQRAREALAQVGLEEKYYSQSPFELSGGEKRRAAIAGVLAMHPEVLVLDEPTAGLDPAGRDEILELLKTLHERDGKTVLLVSHSMEDVARYVEHIVVLDRGTVFRDGTPREVFQDSAGLEKIGLAAPEITYIMQCLRDRGLDVPVHALTAEEAAAEILAARGRGQGGV